GLSAGSRMRGASQNLEHMDKLVLWTHHWRARCANTSSDGYLNGQKLMADSYNATSEWASTTRANDCQSSSYPEGFGTPHTSRPHWQSSALSVDRTTTWSPTMDCCITPTEAEIRSAAIIGNYGGPTRRELRWSFSARNYRTSTPPL